MFSLVKMGYPQQFLLRIVVRNSEIVLIRQKQFLPHVKHSVNDSSYLPILIHPNIHGGKSWQPGFNSFRLIPKIAEKGILLQLASTSMNFAPIYPSNCIWKIYCSEHMQTFVLSSFSK